MRPKVKRKNNMGLLFIVILTCVMLSILLFGVPIWYVNTIHISGNNHYTQEEIMSKAEIAYGMHILQLNKRKSIEKLNTLPYIEAIEVNITLPSNIEIKIVEREAIGYVPFSGTYLCIDKKGRVIDQKEPEQAYGLPIVEGLKFNQFTLGEALEAENEEGIVVVIELTALMGKYNLLDKKIKIDVADPSEIHLYIDKLNVIIGEMKDFDRKIQWLSKVIEGEYKIGVLDLSNVSKGQATMSPVM